LTAIVVSLLCDVGRGLLLIWYPWLQIAEFVLPEPQILQMRQVQRRGNCFQSVLRENQGFQVHTLRQSSARYVSKLVASQV